MKPPPARGTVGTILSITIPLNAAQQAEAEEVAAWVAEHYRRGRDRAGKAATMKFTPTRGRTIEQVNLPGFGAEVAVALYLQCGDGPLPWNCGNRGGHGEPKWADVGRRTDVRWNGRSDGGMYVFDYENTSHYEVLVRGAFPIFVIEGWLWIGEAQQPRYEIKRSEGFALDGWLVPVEDLHALPPPDWGSGEGPLARRLAPCAHQ